MNRTRMIRAAVRQCKEKESEERGKERERERYTFVPMWRGEVRREE